MKTVTIGIEPGSANLDHRAFRLFDVTTPKADDLVVSDNLDAEATEVEIDLPSDRQYRAELTDVCDGVSMVTRTFHFTTSIDTSELLSGAMRVICFEDQSSSSSSTSSVSSSSSSSKSSMISSQSKSSSSSESSSSTSSVNSSSSSTSSVNSSSSTSSQSGSSSSSQSSLSSSTGVLSQG